MALGFAVKFSLLLFRPKKGDIIVGKVKAQDPLHGVQLSTTFFDDIVIPPALMKGLDMVWVPASGPGEEGHWSWLYKVRREEAGGWEGDDAAMLDDDGGGIVDLGLFRDDIVRIRVDSVVYNETHSSSGQQQAQAAKQAPQLPGVKQPPVAPAPGLVPAKPGAAASSAAAAAPTGPTLEDYEVMLLDAAAARQREVKDLFMAGGFEGDGTSLPVIKRTPTAQQAAASSSSSSGVAAAVPKTGDPPQVEPVSADPGALSTVFAPSRNLGNCLPAYSAAQPVNKPGKAKAPFRPSARGRQAPPQPGAAGAAAGHDDGAASLLSALCAPMVVYGSIEGDGFGVLSWWPGETDDADEAQ